MKIHHIRTFAAALACAALIAACTSLSPSGDHVYDPVKTEQVKAAIEPLLSIGLRHVIVNSPQHAVATASYFRAIGQVFAQMRDSQTFDPLFLVAQVDALTVGQQAKLPPVALDAKNAIQALYKVFYGDRFHAELSPEKWPVHVADLLARAIDQALKDAGHPGI
jgi:hypothetical protein